MRQRPFSANTDLESLRSKAEQPQRKERQATSLDLPKVKKIKIETEKREKKRKKKEDRRAAAAAASHVLRRVTFPSVSRAEARALTWRRERPGGRARVSWFVCDEGGRVVSGASLIMRLNDGFECR